jgi:two-component system nitrate/nitrite response regulator NarL
MGAGTRVRVLIADDHPVYLDGIASAVAATEDLELVASCGDGEQALASIRRLAPDVAVLDMRMPGLSGAEVLDALGRERLGTRVLMLSAFADSPEAYESLAAGAAGYLAKDEPRTRICDAIRAIARGRAVIGESAQTRFATELRNRRLAGGLTAREREVLVLLADGLSAPQIAHRLTIGTATVKTHLQHLYDKLGVTDRAAAVAEGMRRGVLR